MREKIEQVTFSAADIPEKFAILKVDFNKESNVLDYIFYDANPLLLAALTLKKQQVVGQKVDKVLNFLSKEELIKLKNYLKQAWEKKKVSFELYCSQIDSWFLLSFDSLGEDYIAALIRNISAIRKKQQKEKPFRELFENSAQGFIMVDSDENIIDANQSFCEMLDYSLEELKQMKSIINITPEYCWKWEEKEIWHKSMLEKGCSEVFEKEFIKKDGSIFQAEVQLYAVTSGFNVIKYYWVAVRSLSERQKLEHAPSFDDLFGFNELDFSPQIVIRVDKYGVSLDLFSTFDAKLYRPREMIIGKNIDFILPVSQAKKFQKAIKKSLSEEQVVAIEYELTINNIDVSFIAKIIPLKDKDQVIALISEKEENQITEESKYRQLIKYNPLGVIHVDSLGIIKECNDSFVKIIDSSRGLLLERNILELQDQKIVATIQSSLKGTTAEYEGYYNSVTANKTSAIRMISAPIYDRNGAIAGAIGIVEDINKRKIDEEGRKNSAERVIKQRQASIKLLSNSMGILHNPQSGAIIADALNAKRVSIWFFNQAKSKLCSWTVFDEGKTVKIDSLLASELPNFLKALTNNFTIKAENAVTDHRTQELSASYLKPLKIKAMLSGAVIVEGQLEGVICVEHRRQKREWHADEESFVSEIAAIIARDLYRQKLLTMNKNLRAQIDMKKMAADISAYFFSQQGSQVSNAINYALKKCGEFFKAEKTYLAYLSQGEQLSISYEWPSLKAMLFKKQFKTKTLSQFPNWRQKLENGDYVYLASVEDSPALATAEAKLLNEWGIKSILWIPLIKNNRLLGIFGLHSLQNTITWSKGFCYLLKVIVELIENLIAGYDNDQQIEYLSKYDKLTALINRKMFEQELKSIKRRKQVPLSLIIADINGLKLINDTMGYQVGDKVLIKVAQIIKKNCRNHDIVSRFGSDEFAILMPHTDFAEAKKISEKIVSAVKDVEIEQLPMSLSVGLASKRSLRGDLFAALKRAEDNLYQSKLTQSDSAHYATLKAILKIAATKSFETEGHVMRMQKMARLLGQKIKLSDSELQKLNLLITLHDIGKISIDEHILNKKEPLTEKEWAKIKQHPENGYNIVKVTEQFADVAEEILAHHERWDGLGYPRGLKGKEIPLLARITAIVDAFDVMSNGRPYRPAKTLNQIIDEFKVCSNYQFDPELVKVFLEIITT